MNALNQSSSQVFSISRFGALLKTYLIENGRTLGLYTLALIALNVLVAAFIAMKMGHFFWEFDGETVNEGAVAAAGTMKAFIGVSFVICWIISSSLAFTSLQTRASRISTFMLPASMLEKFLVRWTVYTLVFFVCFAMAVTCGELTRTLLTKGTVITAFNCFNCNEASSIASLIGFFLCLNATYFLGSSLWPKLSVFKTYVAMMLIGVLLGVATPSFIVDWFWKTAGPTPMWVIISMEYAVAIVLYILAWLRFKHTQIVQRFMMN